MALMATIPAMLTLGLMIVIPDERYIDRAFPRMVRSTVYVSMARLVK